VAHGNAVGQNNMLCFLVQTETGLIVCHAMQVAFEYFFKKLFGEII
jgi:hypothetical protein